MELKTASFVELSVAVRAKLISSREVITYFLDRIDHLDRDLNSFTCINEDAISEAEKIDSMISRGEDPGLLAGIPFAVKDMFCTRGVKTTAASNILKNFVPPYDATVVAKLKSQGAIILGKLNQDEFAMGSSSETSCFGPVKNPWDITCVAGGSSGGSAAAQAARLIAGTLGTDTGGSIRQPASFCGVVGVKPTYGRVSRYGVIAYASSLDQAGPIVSTVSDAALTLEVIAGHDSMDSTTSQRPVPKWFDNLSADIRGKKIGILKEAVSETIDKDVQETFESAVSTLKKLGADIVEITIPLVEMAVPVYYLIAASEASSNLSRYDGVRYGYRSEFKNLASIILDEFYGKTRGEGFGKEVKRRIMLGTYCLSSGYYEAFFNKAGQVRRLLANQFLDAFKKCDVIINPVATSPAFKLGELIEDPLAMYLNDVFTTSANLAGLPAMSVPFGVSKQGLPIGVQITAPHFLEQQMLDVGAALELASPVKGKHPNVF